MTDQSFNAFEYQGRSFDCGSKLGFMMANIALGLASPSLGEELRGQLVELLSDASVDILRLVLAAAHGYDRGTNKCAHQLMAA